LKLTIQKELLIHLGSHLSFVTWFVESEIFQNRIKQKPAKGSIGAKKKPVVSF